jgi:anti-sigma factor RsiW
MIDAHPRHRQLIAISLDGPLTELERAEIQQHIMGCGECRRLERQLRADAAALSVPMRLAPPRRTEAAIERELSIPPVDPKLIRVLRIAIAAAMLILVVVAFAIGTALLQPRPTTPMQTREPQPAGLHAPERTW